MGHAESSCLTISATIKELVHTISAVFEWYSVMIPPSLGASLRRTNARRR
jgi:hypothetical protein